MSTLLVLGVGNLLLSDDGVGVLAAQALAQRDWPEQVDIREVGTFTHDVFYQFDKADTVLVLDAVRSGKAPGTVSLFSEADLIDNPSQRLSLHDIDLLDSLRMAEAYFGTRPALYVLGMEPADWTTWAIGLTPAIEAAFPAFLKAAEATIARLCDRTPNKARCTAYLAKT